MLNSNYGRDKTDYTIEPQRRPHTAYDSESPIAGAKAPWTSARCCRLLRPLSSKIALLRKDKQTASSLDNNGQDDWASSSQRNINAIPTCTQQKVFSASTATIDCAEWDCSPRARKRIRRTYSSKTRRQEPNGSMGRDEDPSKTCCPSTDAVIGLPPTFSQGSWQATANLPASNVSGSQVVPEGRRKNFKNSARTSSGKLIDGICKGLEALLLATTSTSPHASPGCRSLFSTCLRQVPKQIAEEETFATIDDPDNDRDISSEVYNDLEGVGPVSNGGWKPLREVVRAHGLDMIATAVNEGLLGNTIARHIVAICLRLGAYDEAQCVLNCMVSAIEGPKKSTSQTTKPLDDVNIAFTGIMDFAARTQRQGFLYRQTTAMLEGGAVPLEWLSSKAMIECWNGVILSIAQGDDHAQAASVLLRTAISKVYQGTNHGPFFDVHKLRSCVRKGSRRPKLRSDISSQEVGAVVTEGTRTNSASSIHSDFDASPHSALSNVLTVLSAISLLTVSEPALGSQAPTTGSTAILQDLALEAGQRLELASSSMHLYGAEGYNCEWIHLPLLAAGLSSLASIDSCAQLSLGKCANLRALSALPFSDDSGKKAGLFLCTIARCCARAASQDAFDFLQSTVNVLLTVANLKDENEALRGLCGSIALGTAFAFSEDTTRPEHIDWALKVELALNHKSIHLSKATIENTPARGITPSKAVYRWEDGICEWIAKTPAVALRRPSNPALNSRDENEIVETLKSSHEQVLPLLSEWSPLIMHHGPSQDADRPACGEVVALYVRIDAQASDYSRCHTSEMLRFKESSEQRQQKACFLKPLQNIYMDDDFDELSTPESSQEQEPAPVILREISNMTCGAKRKGNLWRSTKAAKFSRSSKRIPVSTRKWGLNVLDKEDEDELSAL